MAPPETRMRRLAAASIALAAALPAALPPTPAAAEGEPPTVGAPAKAAAAGVNAFTADVLRTAAASGGNTFLSPYSISTAVAMARAGAKGATAAEIDAALHLPADAPAAFHQLVAALGSVPVVHEWKDGARSDVPAYALSVANGLFAQRGWAFAPAFGATLRDDYAAEFRDVDFKDGPGTRKLINDWVAAKTKDRIQDIVPPGLPLPDTRLALANAIHFKAQWAEPFQERATQDKPFTVAPGTVVTARLMARTGGLAYAETDDAQWVELPYQGGATSMVVVLPKANDGLDAVVKALTPARLDAGLAALAHRRVALELPKFSFTTSLDATSLLRTLGVRAAFAADAADFTGITTEEPLFIGTVLHKAFVAVDEAGTEAAAATVVMMRAGSAMRPDAPTPFVVDHPFLFLIRHRGTGAVLFAGRVVDPTKP